MKTRILSIGHNSDLLRFRNGVIQNAGYEVTTTKETELVVKLASKNDFAAVVICSSIPSYLRENIARELKRLRPAVPLIIVCVNGEGSCFQNLGEDVVILPPGSSQQPLIDAIARAAGRPEKDPLKNAG